MDDHDASDDQPSHPDPVPARLRDEERRRREWAPYYRAKTGILVIGGVLGLLAWLLRRYGVFTF